MPCISDRTKAIAHQEHIVESYQRQCDINLLDDNDDSVHEMTLNHHKKMLKDSEAEKVFL